MSFAKLWKKAHDNPSEFTSWTNLLDLVEKQQNIDHARKAFEGFFQHFPYCYGYWRKWAEMEKHKGDKERWLQVYASGVKSVPLSIDLWTAYLDAAVELYHGREDYETLMRSLYEEALKTAGLEFRSDALWEHYISWEGSHNHLVNVTDIYTRLMQTPTQLYYQTWDSFKKHVEENRPEDILSRNEFTQLHAQVSLTAAQALYMERQAAAAADDMEPPIVGITKPVVEITDAARNSIRELIIKSREQIYQNTYTQIMKRWYFEEKIRRPYFHVKPLEEVQLNNWAEYLSFEEAEFTTLLANAKSQGDVDVATVKETEQQQYASSDDINLARRRVRILYERCLVPCALYEHLWIRYARYLELTETDIPAAREVWRRACQVHLPYKPTIHWHWGCFEERYPSNLDSPPLYPVLNCLDILTKLEERLTDSALVCCRRADAMRRAKKPLFDIIACLRGGINRLRYLCEEQNKLAKSLSGPTASRTVAQAIATSAQARAGAGVLAGRLARLLHRDPSFSEPITAWMLLLHTVHIEEEEKPEDLSEFNFDSTSDEDRSKLEVSEIKDEDDVDEEGENMDVQEDEPKESTTAESAGSSKAIDTTGTEDDDSSSAESMDEESSSEDEQDESLEVKPRSSPKSDSEATSTMKRKKPSSDNEDRPSKKPKVEDEDMVEDDDEDEMKAAQAREEERLKRERELAAEEEERIRTLLTKRHRLIHLIAPPAESLTDDDKLVLTKEEAAIRVLKEAVEYDPRNERLYAQMLDIVYQRNPINIDGFIEMANSASIDSVLPAAVKLAFCQRKIQFLDEFDSDISRLHVAYEEYLSLCEAVNSGLSAAAIAHGNSRFTTAYPLPDLLNLPSASARMTSVATAGSKDTLVSAGPVTRQTYLNTDQAVLDAAASVGTPAPDPSSSAGYYTAGAYESLAAALGNTSGLPPAVPTNIPMMVSDPSTWGASADPYAYYYAAAGGVSAVAHEFPQPTVSSSNT